MPEKLHGLVNRSSFRSLKPFFTNLVENFGEGPNKSISDAFRIRFFDAQFYADTTIDGITLLFTGGAALEVDQESTINEKVADSGDNTQVIEL